MFKRGDRVQFSKFGQRGLIGFVRDVQGSKVLVQWRPNETQLVRSEDLVKLPNERRRQNSMNRTAMVVALAAVAKDVVAAGEEGSVADKDMRQAVLIRGHLVDRLVELENAVSTIEANLSSFNSPGLKAAFIKALKAGVVGNEFDSARAIMTLRKYYERG